MTKQEYQCIYGHKRYEWYKAHGICTQCGQEDAVPGTTLCPECTAKRMEQCAKYWRSLSAETRQRIIQKKGEQRRALREQRKSLGLCVICGKRKAEVGKLHCTECLIKIRRRNKECYDARRVKTNYSEGLCCRCNEPTLPGKKLCAKHYDIARRGVEAARRGLTNTDHPWRGDNNMIFGKKKQPANVGDKT